MPHSHIESLESRRLLASAGTVEVTDGVLTIRGTTAADDVVVTRVSLAGTVVVDLLRVQFNGQTSDIVAAGIQSIHVDMGAGNDRVVIAKNVKLSCTLIGARGNDTLEGGTRDDVISGGAGSDFLFGGHGSGIDVIYGGPQTERNIFGITRGDTCIGELSTFVADPPNIDLAEGRIVFIDPFGVVLPPFHLNN